MTNFVSPPPPTAKPAVDYQKIIAETTRPDPGLSPNEQSRFIHRYSFAALVWQFVYYFAMGDNLLAWLSIICSVIFVFAPLLLVFPIWARRRAYDSGKFTVFSDYHSAQKKWDRSALYLTLITLVLGLLSIWVFGPALLNAIHTVTGGSTDPNASVTSQLQDAVKQYQDVLGQ